MSVLDKLNSLMPPDVKFTSADTPLTKPIMNVKLVLFAQKHPDMYAKNIHKIRELGEELAYLNGHNMGLNEQTVFPEIDPDKWITMDLILSR